MATVYKIRNKQGLYSTGGTYPNFTKGGKTWSTIGSFNNHISLILEAGHVRNPYKDCELVEIEISSFEKDSKPLEEHILERMNIRTKKNEDRARKLAEWNKEYRKLLESKPKF